MKNCGNINHIHTEPQEKADQDSSLRFESYGQNLNTDPDWYALRTTNFESKFLSNHNEPEEDIDSLGEISFPRFQKIFKCSNQRSMAKSNEGDKVRQKQLHQTSASSNLFWCRTQNEVANQPRKFWKLVAGPTSDIRSYRKRRNRIWIFGLKLMANFPWQIQNDIICEQPTLRMNSHQTTRKQKMVFMSLERSLFQHSRTSFRSEIQCR